MNISRINCLNFRQLPNKKCNNKNKIYFKASNNKYEADFLIEALENLYGKSDQDKVLGKITSFISEHRKTIFGNSGSNARFFNIPFVPNFGLRVKSPIVKTFEEAKNNHFKAVSDIFPSYNFGQAVFSNENGITFNKKVEGSPSSINNWYFYYCNKNLITRKQALEYKDKLEQIAKFPDKTFEDFGKKIELINKKNPRLLDFASPNNFIIDYKKQDITPIDLGDTGIEFNKSLFHSMFHPLVDNELKDFFINKMDDVEKKQCFECFDVIGGKIIDAIENLKKDKF